MFRDQVLKARLVNRNPPLAQAIDACGTDVAQHNVMSERRKADTGHEADIANPNDSDACYGVLPFTVILTGVSVCPFFSLAAPGRTMKVRMSRMVTSDSARSSESVLVIQ